MWSILDSGGLEPNLSTTSSIRYLAFIKLYDLLKFYYCWFDVHRNGILPEGFFIKLAYLGQQHALQGSLKWMPGTQACISLLRTIPVHIYVWLYLSHHLLSWTHVQLFLLQKGECCCRPQGPRVCTRNWAESISSSFFQTEPHCTQFLCVSEGYTSAHCFHILVLINLFFLNSPINRKYNRNTTSHSQ